MNPDNTVTVAILNENMHQVAVASISEVEWQRINYVDYIQVDSTGRPLPEFYENHGRIAAEAMQGVAVRTMAAAGMM